MALRIVVAFATDFALDRPGADADHLQALLSLGERAEVRGGRLCALGPQNVAFDFAPDEAEEALSLALTEHRDGSLDPTRSARFAVGVAQGEMAPLVDAGSRALPSWGVPLVVAGALARVGAVGEVIVARDFAVAHRGELLTAGPRAADNGTCRVEGLLVDPARVWRRESLSGADRPGGVDRESSPAKRARARSPSDGADRLTAIAAVARGDVGEGLAALQSAVERAGGAAPEVRSRGWLALAVGLGVAGRSSDALLAGLEALARAREARDPVGEHACVRFLAKLSLAAGHPLVAARWSA